ncbi:MAG: hypothetical protein ACFFEY_02305 [Candidatus Thorarchaeota archaeon]
MVSKEVIEERTNEIAPIILPTKPQLKEKKKGRIRRFFSNEDFVLVLFSLGASAIMIILLLIAGTVGAKIPTGIIWY